MKTLILLSLLFTTHLTLAEEATETAVEKTGASTPAMPEGELKEETDLKTEKTVTGIGFLIVAPAGWSFMNIDYSKKPAVILGEYRAKIKSTGELIITPGSNVLESEVSLKVRNYSPQALDIVIQRRLYQNNGAKLATKKFQNKEWQVIEFWNEGLGRAKKTKKSYNWYATTKIKGGDLAITATAPFEDREKYRAPFESMMKSVKVLE